MTTQNTQEPITKTIIQTTETASKTPTLTADLAATAGIHDLATFNTADLSGMSDEVKQALFLSLIGPKRHNRGGQNGQGQPRSAHFLKARSQTNSRIFIPLKNSLNLSNSKGQNVTSKDE